MIDLHKYWHAVRLLVLAPSLPPGELARTIITWLFIAVIVHSLYGFRRFLLLFPLLCGAEFLGKILIVDNVLKLTDIVGAAVAFVLWAGVLRRIPGRFGMVALLFAGMITAERLEPFTFESVPHSFGLIPFAGLMSGSNGMAMQAFCQKFYEYGGLIWLLARAGLPSPIGTMLTATLLLATSIAECWLPGRSAQITDAIMALVIGFAFAFLRSAVRGRVPTVASIAPTDAARAQARMVNSVLAQHGIPLSTPTRRRGRKHAPYVPPRLRG